MGLLDKVNKIGDKVATSLGVEEKMDKIGKKLDESSKKYDEKLEEEEKIEQKKELEAEKKEEAKRIEAEKELKAKEEKEIKKQKEIDEKASKVIVSTGDIKREYEIVEILFGFAKDRSYISQYERALNMLKYNASLKGCDGVIHLQIQMMEGKQATGSTSLTGALVGAVTEKVLEEAVFPDQIPKDGAIVFGTGVKFK